MVCNDCIYKLALRLVRNHPDAFDWIRALEKASGAIERYEKSKQKLVVNIDGVEVDPDYSQACLSPPTNQCTSGILCISYTECGTAGGTCDCGNAAGGCPAPLANSHYVSDTCVSLGGDCLCSKATCSNANCLGCSGNCFYDCNPGFVWNGVACVPVVPPAAQPIMDGFYFVSMFFQEPMKTIRKIISKINNFIYASASR